MVPKVPAAAQVTNIEVACVRVCASDHTVLFMCVVPLTCDAGVVCKEPPALLHVLPGVISTPQDAHWNTRGNWGRGGGGVRGVGSVRCV